ncbi:myotubularin-related protein 3 [Engraulis encrasicolus]|uniref:myotubularin-related protein 3 n=1 Tax=Engraulis encrasicolus TaxID=184585 RepID=UPI002FD04F8E
MEEEEGQGSLECIQANQIFPRKPPVLEQDDLQVPYAELDGESTRYVGLAEDAVIAMSNYRLHIKYRESIVNVPLQLIESVECRDMFQLHITCKDCKVVRCQFSSLEQCQEWSKRLVVCVRPPARLEELFAFAYHAWCIDVYTGEREHHAQLCRPGDHVTSRFQNEVERMAFDTQNAWRVSHINNKHKLCASYPEQLLVPAWITDKELEKVAAFRSWKRIPAVVYRHQSTGAVIARCGQPEVSWWGWRNADDEHLVQSIAKACAVDTHTHTQSHTHSHTDKPIATTSSSPNSPDLPNGADLNDTDFESSLSHSAEVETLAIQPQKLLILDARSYAAAVANRAKGGGCECPEYYPNCEVVFMGMANIHSIRKSFQALRLLCTQMPDPANWLSALESTKWLQHLSLLLKAAVLVVNAVDRDQRPALVHCSDGWDRTPQIAALAKLMLDPYYRTVEGFQVLVETEWLDFGHKFADRCGHGENAEDLNERCPVYLQWLDAVHQLHKQFPCSFEFNEAFLVKLVQHTYSCLYGTFLCNSGREREERHTQERTCSVWTLLRPANRAFRNMLYSSHSDAVLRPVCHVRNLMLWTAVYLPCSLPTTPPDDSCAPYPEDQPLGRRAKTRSFDNLPAVCEVFPSRRSSDPSLNDKWQQDHPHPHQHPHPHRDPHPHPHPHRRSLEITRPPGLAPDHHQDQDSEEGSGSESSEGLTGPGVLTRPGGGGGGGGVGGGLRTGPVREGAEPKKRELEDGVNKEEEEEEEEEGEEVTTLQNVTRDAMALQNVTDQVNVTARSARTDTPANATTTTAAACLNGATHPTSATVTTVGDKDRDTVCNDTDATATHTNDAAKPNGVCTTHTVNGSLSRPAAPTSTPHHTVEPESQEPRECEAPSALRTMSSGGVSAVEGAEATPTTTPAPTPPPQQPPTPLDKRLSLLESSTETLTEEGSGGGVTMDTVPRPTSLDPPSLPPTPPHTHTITDMLESASSTHVHTQTHTHPSQSALASGPLGGPNPLTNGEAWKAELDDADHTPSPLSRQLSAASSQTLTHTQTHTLQHSPTNTHTHTQTQAQIHTQTHTHLPQHRCCPHGPLALGYRPSATITTATSVTMAAAAAEHRSHLDEDGLPLHTDAVQVRMRQMEAQHQLEVDALKQQLQQLWSRLHQQQTAGGATKINGDMGDDLTSMSDSDLNMDANCLSRCSTELFSEASWEQVDKQDTEVTRWYPDHLAAHCYGCQSKFWLATRKHHCRNCGNVFCGSCCDQKIPVPSQQLFEPSRVCRSCYTSLQAAATAANNTHTPDTHTPNTHTSQHP